MHVKIEKVVIFSPIYMINDFLDKIGEKNSTNEGRDGN